MPDLFGLLSDADASAPIDPADLAEAVEVTVGEDVAGALDSEGEVDLFVFESEPGVHYQIDVTLGTLADSVATLHDADGTALMSNDDFGGTMASRISWQARDSGRLYVAVEGYGGANTGSYTLAVAEAADDHASTPESAAPVTVGEATPALWRYDTGLEPYQPRVSEGVVYASAGNYLYALDAATGRLNWSYGWLYASFGPPEPVAGTVYVTSTEDDAFLDAVDAETGERRWRFQMGAFTPSAPIVSDAVVYTRSMFGPVHALNAATGELIWELDPGGYGLVDVDSLVLSEGIVFVDSGDDLSVLALDSGSGEVLWTHDTDGHPSLPVVADGTAYVPSEGADGGYVDAVDAATGQFHWRYRTNAPSHRGLAVTETALYVPSEGADGGYVDAVDAATGQFRWRYRTNAPTVYEPVAAEGALYVRSEDADGGYVDAVDAATGERRWRHEGKYWSSLCAVSDGIVYVGSFDGYLHALDAATGDLRGEYRFDGYLSSCTVTDGTIAVAYAGGVSLIQAASPH